MARWISSLSGPACFVGEPIKNVLRTLPRRLGVLTPKLETCDGRRRAWLAQPGMVTTTSLDRQAVRALAGGRVSSTTWSTYLARPIDGPGRQRIGDGRRAWPAPAGVGDPAGTGAAFSVTFQRVKSSTWPGPRPCRHHRCEGNLSGASQADLPSRWSAAALAHIPEGATGR